MRRFITILLFIFIIMHVYPEAKFSGMDLGESNTLLFKLSTDSPGYGKYETLFQSQLKTGELKQLTCFPEQMILLKDSKEVRIHNRFGVFRVNTQLGEIEAIDLFSSFVKTNTLKVGKLPPIQSSPDGKYLLYISEPQNAYGNLTLYDIDKMEEYLVSEKVDLDFNNPPGLWSPDSQYFIYSKKDSIYYFSMNHLEENRVFAENMRIIGDGVLKNVSWADKNTLYYIKGTFVYKILSSEFFSRAFYKDVLRIGTVSGKIPFDFDPNFDTFWIGPDGKKILLSKEGRNLFLYFLKSDDFTSVGDVQSLPYLYLPNNSQISRIIWSKEDQITVLARKIISGKKSINLFRIAVKEDKAFSSFMKTDDDDVTDLILSPDEKSVVLIKENKVELRNYLSWQLSAIINHPNALNAIWQNENELVIAGEYTSILYNFLLKKTTLLSLSQTGDYGFSEDEQSVIMKLQGKTYARKIDNSSWKPVSGIKTKKPDSESESFRVYISESQTGLFENMIMVRNIEAETYGTFPLFEEPRSIQFEPFPEKDDKISFDVFNHGSRLRRREVSLVFNVIDSIQGLTTILNVLSDYHINATFFINGEAIVRYPGGITEIANSGHEVGSLFYSYFNMTNSKYNLDKEFIKKGLGITEDEYFAATGHDLDLYWHAPYYFVNSGIIEASKEMNYTYVGKDIDTMDWVSENESSITRGIYLTSSELIEKIMKDKKPGSIIPILVGLPQGKRKDYLFQKLDTLINALLNKGYTIVPVSTLIRHAK
ncbi:MAG: polysaccharide deacetylase family protein [Spirochaetales bacterium]|nr:polysaccharide deacetylase family protein [Spirochaetales bacterium]